MIPFPAQTGAMLGMIPSYKVDHFHVFFGDRYLCNADWFGFEDLGQGYGLLIPLIFLFSSFCNRKLFLGKNTKQVFYMGELIYDADAFSFKVFENGVAKDKRRAFQHGLPAHHTTSFQFRSPSQIHMQTMHLMQPVFPKSPMIPMPYTGGMISPMFQPKLSYVVENFHVFFNHQYLSNANWIHFIDLGQGYG